jgi:Protein of unknown function (DUF1353)
MGIVNLYLRLPDSVSMPGDGGGNCMSAHYVGRPRVEFSSDGRNVKLLDEFSFVDAAELAWSVPAETIVDGASIPQIFWSFMKGPFEGKYRDASIIHDWYCYIRERTWEATHRVFYEAMLVSGVGKRRAQVMYFAVRWGGPRWDWKTSYAISPYRRENETDLQFRQREAEHRRQETLPFRSDLYWGELPQGYNRIETREAIPIGRPSDNISRLAKLERNPVRFERNRSFRRSWRIGLA